MTGGHGENWRLLAMALMESYFEGTQNQLVLRHDTVALQVHQCTPF